VEAAAAAGAAKAPTPPATPPPAPSQDEAGSDKRNKGRPFDTVFHGGGEVASPLSPEQHAFGQAILDFRNKKRSSLFGPQNAIGLQNLLKGETKQPRSGKQVEAAAAAPRATPPPARSHDQAGSDKPNKGEVASPLTPEQHEAGQTILSAYRNRGLLLGPKPSSLRILLRPETQAQQTDQAGTGGGAGQAVRAESLRNSSPPPAVASAVAQQATKPQATLFPNSRQEGRRRGRGRGRGRGGPHTPKMMAGGAAGFPAGGSGKWG
jgi:hypothetical protein